MKIQTISAENRSGAALEDLWRGLKLYNAWTLLALHEVRQQFRRSTLGPLWLTVSMGIFIGTLGFIASTLFGLDSGQHLPHIAIGIIIWGFLVGCITDGSTTYISKEIYIRNIPLPVSLHAYQSIMRNLIIFAFNMIIYVALIVYFRRAPNEYFLLLIAGVPLFILNVGWMALLAGVLSTRFRDIPQIIVTILQLLFFLTPVFWSPEMLPTRPIFVTFNPLYHLLEIVREPLLGESARWQSWASSLFTAIGGWAVTLFVYRRSYARIPYWV